MRGSYAAGYPASNEDKFVRGKPVTSPANLELWNILEPFVFSARFSNMPECKNCREERQMQRKHLSSDPQPQMRQKVNGESLRHRLPRQRIHPPILANPALDMQMIQEFSDEKEVNRKHYCLQRTGKRRVDTIQVCIIPSIRTSSVTTPGWQQQQIGRKEDRKEGRCSEGGRGVDDGGND